VEVQVLGEILPPGVQDRGGAEIPAELAGIASEGGERVGDGMEEEGIDEPGIPLGEGVTRRSSSES